MSKQQNNVTGNKGERLAAEHLQIKGYEILQRNYRSKWGEVDIVCKFSNPKFSNPKFSNPKFSNSQMQEEYRVFVEVKTKTGEQYGEPWEMIDKHKLKQVENMGHLWCEEMGWRGLCRIDVVGVWLDLDGAVERIEHWENVQI